MSNTLQPPAVDLLARFLTAAGVSIYQLAEAIHVPARTLYHWTSGKAGISLRGALAIEAWSAGAVPARAWLSPESQRQLIAISMGQPQPEPPP